MMRKVILYMLWIIIFSGSAEAVTRYVDGDNGIIPSQAPYTNWATAARQIQEALDISDEDDVIVVTNGIYNTGSMSVSGLLARIATTNIIHIESVNGPDVTVIDALSIMRGGFLHPGSSLDGFTVRNGRTGLTGDPIYEQSGGGLFCEVNAMVTNCIIMNCSANEDGCGIFGGTICDSLVVSNSADSAGGGVYSGVVYRCEVRNNTAQWGGGIARSPTWDTRIESNEATGILNGYGGGYAEGFLSNCVVIGNAASGGGAGINDADAWNCIITDNIDYSPTYGGGGFFIGTANNCFIARNYAIVGGGAHEAMLNNCTVVDNRAQVGGGTHSCDVYNSIVYYNRAYYECNDMNLDALGICIF